MSVNYQKLYCYLVGQVDDALGMMHGKDMVAAAPIREKLHNALLTAEDMYMDAEEDETPVILNILK